MKTANFLFAMLPLSDNILRGSASDRPMLSRWQTRMSIKKVYLFALVILSFHALPVGDLSAAAQPFAQDLFHQRQQINELRAQQQLDHLQREQELNQAQEQLNQMRQRGQTNPGPRPEQLNDVQRQLDQMRNDQQLNRLQEDEQLNQLRQNPERLQQNRLEQLRNDQELNRQQLQERFNQTQQQLDQLRR